MDAFDTTAWDSQSQVDSQYINCGRLLHMRAICTLHPALVAECLQLPPCVILSYRSQPTEHTARLLGKVRATEAGAAAQSKFYAICR